MTPMNIILFITAMSTAAIAGLLYAYSYSVILGLAKLPDKEYLSAMQSINREILNPVFFATFMGTVVLLPLSAYLNYGNPRFNFLVIAAIVYIIGVFGVTVVGNVPLNDTLNAFQIKTATFQQIIDQRTHFEQPWNKFHQWRTIASLVSLALVIISCMNSSKMIN